MAVGAAYTRTTERLILTPLGSLAEASTYGWKTTTALDQLNDHP